MACTNCGEITKSAAPALTNSIEEAEKEAGAEQAAVAEAYKRKGKGRFLLVAFLSGLALILLVAGIAFLGIVLFRSKGMRAIEPVEAMETTEETKGTIGDLEETLPLGTVAENVAETDSVPVKAQEFSVLLADLNSASNNAISGIDVFAENYTPGTRNENYSWDRTLFYSLEDVNPNSAADGLINGYDISRKMLQNTATGNPMEYEIYLNPVTGKVNKIVSIDYKSDYLEITDYYFDDYEKVSFIFTRVDINYIPSYAVPTKDGERYYFNNDNMVKWRAVINGVQSNYVIGPEAAKENLTGAIFQYANLNEGQKATFDQTEKRMINAAYNTYNTVLSARGISEITGYVYDENGIACAGAQVSLLLEGENTPIYTSQVNETGKYRVLVPTQNQKYRLLISQENCVSAMIYGIEVDEQTLSDYQDAVSMVKRSDTAQPVKVQMYDALNYATEGSGMERLSSAAVYVREGMNHREGGVVAQGTSDLSGQIGMVLPPGMYTAEVVKSGYDNTYYNFAVKDQMGIVAINASPKLEAGEVRIVLTWGETPSDLDSHLFTPYDNVFGDETYHIWYGNKSDAVGNNLDVDDVTSYGPETMTIPVLKNGLYKYYVADFTNCSDDNPGSYQMSNSGALINVYTSEGLASTFNVPSNLPGVIWEVFEIRNGSVVPIQRYYSTIEDKAWWHNDK